MDLPGIEAREKERLELKRQAEKPTETIFEKPATLLKLLHEEPYNREDIHDSAKIILDVFDFEKYFEIIEKDKFEPIRVKVHPEAEEIPFSFLYEKEEGQWVFFIIIKRENKYTIFYKDSSGAAPPPSLENYLKKNFSDPKIVVHSSKDHDENDVHLSGPFALRNLRKMYYKWRKEGEKFTENFQENKFFKMDDLIAERYRMLRKTTLQLSNKTEFLTKLKKFLEEENKFLDSEDLTREVGEEFPLEMEQMDIIFRLLAKNKTDKQFYIVLNNISKVLHLNEEKFKQFYENK